MHLQTNIGALCSIQTCLYKNLKIKYFYTIKSIYIKKKKSVSNQEVCNLSILLTPIVLKKSIIKLLNREDIPLVKIGIVI